MHAVVEIQGVQYRVAAGDRVRAPLRTEEAGSKVTLDKVLLLDEGNNITIGHPTIPEAVVEATIQTHGREKKIIVFKMRRRKDYRVKNGHRQPYTLLHIDTIKVPGVQQPPSAESSESIIQENKE